MIKEHRRKYDLAYSKELKQSVIAKMIPPNNQRLMQIQQSAENASRLISQAVIAQNIARQQEPLVLHTDNGSPMKGASMLETLYQLGITPSRSRPRVSNDNPYSESIFRICKYCPSYPSGGFSTLEDSRIWVKSFVHWYNYHHRHSGQGEELLVKRHHLYETAKAKHPERWSRQTRDWSIANEVWLNPEKSNIDATKKLISN